MESNSIEKAYKFFVEVTIHAEVEVCAESLDQARDLALAEARWHGEMVDWEVVKK